MELIIKFLIIFILATITSASEYCNICLDHVACNNDNQFKSTCPSNAKMVWMSSSSVKTFLNTHNKNRNKIASGSQSGFKTASQMTRLVKKLI